MAINNSYLHYSGMQVKDTSDFMSSGLPEIPKVKSLMAACKSVFNVGNNMIQLLLLENRVYEIDIFTDTKKKNLLGKVYYIPTRKQLDVYDLSNEYPCISWINRRVVSSQFSGLVSKMKIETLFQPLVASVL